MIYTLKTTKLLVLSSLIFIGCNTINTPKKYYYPDGKISYIDFFNENGELIKRETYYNNGKSSGIITYKNGKLSSSKFFEGEKQLSEYFLIRDNKYGVTIYENNRIIKGFGKVDSLSREVGWWTFYEHKKLIHKRTTLIVNNDPIITQKINFKNGKIDSLHSQFADVRLEKQTRENLYTGTLCYTRKLNKKSYVSILVGSSINSNFSNFKSADIDTIAFETEKLMEFPIEFQNKGKKTLRGFIIEQYSEGEFDKKKEVEMREIQIPFEVELIVD